MEDRVKKTKEGAFTLPELMVGIAILVLLCLICFSLIKQTLQKTKIVVAKASIAQYATLLEVIKGDVNYYPPEVNETLESLSYDTAPAVYGHNWHGPYLKATPIDPWKKPYFYHLVYGVIFGPQFLPRVAGPPSDETYHFNALPGPARIIMNNDCQIDHSGQVWLNGTEVITQNEFQKDIPLVEKDITLTASNDLRIRLTSNPGSYVLISLTSPFSRKSGYVIGSYGSDGKAGGVGFARDIRWESNQSGADF